MALKKRGHDLTLVSGDFRRDHLEEFFGFDGLFAGVSVKTYSADPRRSFGTYGHLLHHEKSLRKMISESDFDLVFSTQDAGYIPDISRPVFQWGYYPNSLPGGIYGWPLRVHYSRKIQRTNLILAISKFSKESFDKKWKAPTCLVYPACNMVQPSSDKERIVVTAARAVPEKNLELFWEIAKQRTDYKFVLLMTVDPRFLDYSRAIQAKVTSNGLVVTNPSKDLYQQYLSRATIYLHLMKGEHFGITIVESMSAGCVPIVHNSGGPREIVQGVGLLWQKVEEIPELLTVAEASYSSMARLSIKRAQKFNREKFDESLGEVFSRIV